MSEFVVPKDIAEKLGETLFQGDKAAAVAATQEALASGVAPLALVQKVIIPSLVEVGRRFETLEIFLPELMQAGEIGSACSKVVEEELVKRGGEMRVEGVVVIGTAKGDIHDIGKNIVISLFKAHGYKVIDLGKDVSAIAFVEAAEANHADVIAASALMSITRAGCREVADLLRELDLSDKYHFIVGGGSLDQAYADEIGADGYSSTASGAVELVKSLMSN
jgi:5-methyltetrahydrofolate--homocysteine methyltransferase